MQNAFWKGKSKTMKKIGVVVAVMLGGVLLVHGCRKKATPKKEKPLIRDTEFSFVNTNEQVVTKDIPFQRMRDVEVDLDGDGKKDMVVIRKTEKGDEVAIYINKAMGRYYIGGKIQKITRGDIIGLMVNEVDKKLELSVVISERGGPNQVIHYRSDGSSLQELPDPFKKKLQEAMPLKKKRIP